MSPAQLTAALARLRDNARRCRRAAFRMKPSVARSAIERIAVRWEIMAAAEARSASLTPANDS